MLRNWALALRPSLSLDFLAGLNDPRITYSGGANGTRVDSSGNIVAATTPRFDYDPVTLAAKGLLVEEARTNVLTNSGDWGTDLFLSSAATVTPAAGGLCNKRISFTASANALTVKYNTAGNSTLQYANTVRLKAGSFTSCIVSFRNAAQTIGIQYTVNLSAVTLTDNSYGSPTSKITPSIKLVGGGEYEITIGGVLNSGGGAETLGFYVFNPGSTAGTLDVGAGQSEVGAFATSYIPTTSASVTRTADSAVMTGTNFSSWYNPTESTFVTAFDIPYAVPSTSGPRVLCTSDAVAESNNGQLIFSPGITGKICAINTFSGGTNGGRLDAVEANTPNAVIKAAASFALGDRQLSVNGATPVSSAGGALPVGVDRLYIGGGATVATYLNGHIRSIVFYPSARPGSLQALSS